MFDWLRKLFRRKQTLSGHADLIEKQSDGALVITDFKTHKPETLSRVPSASVETAKNRLQFEEMIRQRSINSGSFRLRERMGPEAVHQDVSKFMKHKGHQLKEYRRSVKAKVKPEEEEEN